MPSGTITAIAEYRNDVTSALRFYFSNACPSFNERFLGYSLAEVTSELRKRLNETDRRSSLAILISLERAFRLDYKYRCLKKAKGNRHLLKAFQTIRRSGRPKVRLDDIFEAWKQNVAGSKRLIGELKGAFKFRHWLAHGEYWELKANKYDFDSLYDIGDEVLRTFDFVTPD
jgi:hypothetical protein